ncbi:MAG: FeoA family protein [Chloroflexi bacterium]|nr:FeoA family protein [Chloroflexota bacterium]
MRLIDAEQGIWVSVLGFEGNEKFQDRLLQHGLYPGDRARILRAAPLKGPLLVEVSGREIALGRAVANKILVELAE